MSDIAKMIAFAKMFDGGSSTPAPVVILPETELTLSDGPYIFTTPWAVEIVAGGVYVVTYNGVEYECEAYDSPEAPGTLTVMGNSEFLASMGITGGNPDAPFYLMCLSNAFGAEEGAYGQLSTDGNSASVTLSIVEAAKTESAGGGGGVFVVNATKTTETESPLLPEIFLNAWNVEFDKTMDEVLAACIDGKHVECRLMEEEGSVTIYHLNSFAEKNHMIMFSNMHMVARQFVVWMVGEPTISVLISDN